jgi:Ca-activated chloride channel family protein
VIRIETLHRLGLQLGDSGNPQGTAIAQASMKTPTRISTTTGTPRADAARSSTRCRLLALTAIACLALLAAACGSDDEASDTAAETERTVEVDNDAEDTLAGGTEGDDESAVQAESGYTADSEEEATEDAADAVGEDLATGAADQADRSTVPESGGFFEPDLERREDDGDNTFQDYGIRSFISTERDPLSTFALDVDTGAYTVARRLLQSGQLPPRESVRVEEYVNRFNYDYPAPRDGLTVVAEGGPSPFNADNVVIRVGVQAERVEGARPSASLTFVIDTSGSMDRPDRLELVKSALIGLTRRLEADDSVAIVTYSDGGQVILEPTEVADEDRIIEAIDSLRPNGSTNLEDGLAVGYALANQQYRGNGVNRVILASDGIANVGLTDPDGLSAMIRDDADEGIQLITVGVGMDSYNDVMMEQLADQGDGFYAYVDEVSEAERLFGDELTSTLVTAAVDGKIQIEFNPETVAEYRLLGFENRAVLDDDFRNDSVDAGELGAGHQVTALYELVLRPGIDDRDHLGTVQLRWQDPDDRSVRETRLELNGGIIEKRWADTGDDFRLAVTVASFAEILRDSPHRGDISLSQVQVEAESLARSRGFGAGDVDEFVELVALAREVA